MNRELRIAIAQINCSVGDFEGNSKKIISYIRKAEENCSDIVAFPELAVTGYPPEDLLLKAAFVAKGLDSLKEIAKAVRGIMAIVGFVDKEGNDIYNAAAIIYKGSVKGIYRKILLPNYGVFDEKRYFRPGERPAVFGVGKFIFGVNICEDIWHDDGPTRTQAEAGAGLIININASPYHAGKTRDRDDVVRREAKKNSVAVVYANLVGGQDELVFDGHSLAVDSAGKIVARAAAFKEDLLVTDLEIPLKTAKAGVEIIMVAQDIPAKEKRVLPRNETKPLGESAEVYEALVLGLKDYMSKNGFEKAIVGLSGGIDSALVAAIAADAIGKENVIGVFMSSRYSSEKSHEDAKALSGNAGIKFMNISIDHIFKIYLMTLEPHFSGKAKDVTEENLQARIRGNILMALSNKFGWLVLTTGNKSEMSTGYATLYGDMAGGFAVIKDVPKTLVYKLAKYRNSLNAIIPESIMKKEPTAELKPDQKDSDTLPPYGTLDQVLKAYVEEDKDVGEITSLGFDKETVLKVLNMVDRSEYKRRQSPPGIKITPKAFGRDRRMPITNRYKEY
jgi:NAD+ synthase (glutamine-hydrolysing)